MKSLVKWLLIAVTAVILLPVLLGLVASAFIDPNEFKPQLIEAVEKNTRGSLSIDGELNWSLFPSIGVQANQVQFSLPEDGEKPFAKLEGVELGVKLLPLLRLAVEADGLTVSGLELNMRTDKNGVNNWEHIFPEGDKSDAPPAAEESSGSSVQAGPLAVDIARVAILDSSVHVVNEQDGSRYLLNDFNFESTDISVDGDEFPLDMRFNVALSDPSMTADAQIRTKLSADMAAETYAFQGLSADFLLAGEPFAGEKVNINLTSSGLYNGASNSADLQSLTLDIADALRAEMAVKATGLDAKMKLAGTMNVASFNAKELMAALGMEPMETAEASALTDISFSGTLSGPANSVILNPVKLRLDSTSLSGQMGIKNMDTSEYVFELKGDKINVDDYSGPAEETTADSSQPNAALLPLAALRDLLFTAEFGFDEVLAGGLKITGLVMKANGDQGLIKLKRMKANLYEGTMNMTAAIDGRKDTPTLAINTKLANLNIQSLMKDFADIDTVSGTARFDGKLRASGNSTQAFQSSLSGPLEFQIDNAVLSNLNVDKLACQAIAQVRRKPLAAKEWPATTQFKKLGGTFQFNDGVGSNNDLAATLDNMQVKGGGSIDLNTESVDYRVALHINGDLSEPGESGEKSACAINQKYRDIGWPMRCKGKLSDEPGDLCGLDTEGLAKVAGQLLKAEASDKLKEKLGEALFGKKKEGDVDAGEEAAEEESAEDKLKKKLFEKLF